MKFFSSHIFLVTVLLQTVGPFLFTFGNWANIIQYLSGYGMAYAIWHYLTHHKKDIQHLIQRIEHLHEKVEDNKHAN